VISSFAPAQVTFVGFDPTALVTTTSPADAAPAIVVRVASA
jgi:hypothetical protein